MKKLIFIILCSFQFSFVVFGQHPFAPLGAKWVYTEPKILNLFEGPKYFEITDLDTIQGKVCSRITYDTSFMGDVTHFYQDSNKIYFRVKNSEIDTFLLFFDQSAKQGDTLDIGVRNAPFIDLNSSDSPVYYSMKIIIDSMRVEEIDDIKIKVWYLHGIDVFLPYTCHEIGRKYYENIGYNNKFLPYFLCLDPGLEMNLRCYEDPVNSIKFVDYPCDYHSKASDIAIYDDIAISPNPANSTVDITFPDSFRAESATLYNKIGQNIKSYSKVYEEINISDLKSGLYILVVRDKDGKLLKGKFVKI